MLSSQRARTPGPSASHAPPNASDIRHTAKRVMHPPSAAGPASSQTFGATKRARVGTSARLETNSQLPASSRRHDAVGAFPATPCPQSSKPNSNRSDNLMLVASEARPAGQGTATDRLNSSSRLPLKATFPASHQALPLSWHSVGLDPSTRATFATATHLVGVGRPAAQDHHRAAFRPRPSLASVSTSCSSVPSTSLFSGRSSRIASTATTASSESFERC